ncbi:hypothetical protein BX070DRAFT_230562 [Coemansia spiralis]|nr:hypothetical protein BX070DRAFT_230562 [Coemansia spiralis]
MVLLPPTARAMVPPQHRLLPSHIAAPRPTTMVPQLRHQAIKRLLPLLHHMPRQPQHLSPSTTASQPQPLLPLLTLPLQLLISVAGAIPSRILHQSTRAVSQHQSRLRTLLLLPQPPLLLLIPQPQAQLPTPQLQVQLLLQSTALSPPHSTPVLSQRGIKARATPRDRHQRQHLPTARARAPSTLLSPHLSTRLQAPTTVLLLSPLPLDMLLLLQYTPAAPSTHLRLGTAPTDTPALLHQLLSPLYHIPPIP